MTIALPTTTYFYLCEATQEAARHAAKKYQETQKTHACVKIFYETGLALKSYFYVRFNHLEEVNQQEKKLYPIHIKGKAYTKIFLMLFEYELKNFKLIEKGIVKYNENKNLEDKVSAIKNSIEAKS